MTRLLDSVMAPVSFVRDTLRKRERLAAHRKSAVEGKTPTYAFHFAEWKREFFCACFPERQFHFVPPALPIRDFARDWLPLIGHDTNAEFFVWGLNIPEYAKDIDRKKFFVEDGFIRSVALGSTHALPFSITVDSITPYYDSRGPSDLERLMMEFDFSSRPELLERARGMMARLLDTGLSKYNQNAPVDIASIYGPKDRKRILVVGQVEDDASIRFGSDKRYTNNDLVRIARIENPDAHIVYKPHPDVLHRKRAALSNPDEVRPICQVLEQDIPLSDSFQSVDHVYTITSQAGFEALMRGIAVTALGCPFYAGWGLTDDRQANPRRKRKLSLTEVFAAAYVLYPRYFDPELKVAITPEQAVDRLITLRDLHRSSPPRPPLS